MVKYYIVRILALLLLLSSFRFGLLAYAEYGKWIGWVTFIIFMVSAFILYIVAGKLRRPNS
jgi:hypothetical protein